MNNAPNKANNDIRRTSHHNGSRRTARRISLLFGFMILALVLVLAGSGSPQTLDAAGGPVCYTVADSSDDDKNQNFDDVLALVDLETGHATFLGQAQSGVVNIEATEFDPVGGELFAIDGATLGTLDQFNGDFTSIGGLGDCEFNGGGIDFTISDADGLAKDFMTGEWYGAAREQNGARTEPDYLFKLPLDGSGNPTTPIDPNGFGTGVSCVPIDTISLPGGPDLVDDLGIDPANGDLYGVANKGATTATRIIKIDKTDGSTIDIGQAQNSAGVFLPDIEGFSIDESGRWLMSTGQDGGSPTTDDSIWVVDPPPIGPFPTTVAATRIAQLRGDGTLFNANDAEYDPLLSYEDWEAITCYNVSNVTASIGDYTWLDSNGDGIQDSGEPAAPGVDVTLYGSTDTTIGNGDDWVVGTLTTDPTGLYTFPVPAGNYYLEFDPAQSYTLQNQGGDDAADSDPDPSTGLTELTTLDPGENDETWDAGLIAASVGDYVWLDSNGDGIQDSGEPGVPGIEVKIFDSGDNEIGTTVTDENGMYGFTVPPGDYYIQFDPVQSYTMQNQGGDDSADSDPPAGVGTGQTATFTLSAGENDDTWDAGLVPAEIGDFVWADLDGDGIQDDGEPGVSGVTVELFDPGEDGIVGTFDDVLLQSQLTGGDGSYLFYVPPGDYYVRFDPALSYSPIEQGGDPTKDSNADPATGRSPIVTVAGGEQDHTIDAGIVETARIGDLVWSDLNVNGIQDGGDAVIVGATVNLYTPGPDGQPGGGDDTLVGTTVTDGTGNYSFAVPPGDYFVEFIPPAGWSFSPPNQGGDPALDSDADVSTGLTPVTTLEVAENDTTWDAGLYMPEQDTVAVGNIVWHDANDNGLRDAGEAGISGVSVFLYSSGDTPGVSLPAGVVLTDANGRYLFPNVTPGTYFVAVDSGDAALGATPYTTVGGDHQPDTTGDHPAADGDDGRYFETASPWVVSQDFPVSAGGQTAPDIEDPVNIDDASAYMTIDFGFTATPVAITLAQFGVQASTIPLALAAALFMLLATSAVLFSRSRLAENRA